MSLSIGDVAARSGLSRDTLRYYEKIGLVPHARRSPSGQREYEEPVLDQLLVVTALRNAGFSIAQVREVLNVKKTTTSIHSRIDAMRSTIDDLERSLDERQEAIHVARRQLQDWRRELDAGESWPDAPLSTFSAG